MQAAQVVESEPFERLERLGSRHLRRQVEAHVGGRPAAEGAAKNRDAAATKENAAEEADRPPALIQPRHHDVTVGERGDELEPMRSLGKRPILERVQSLPVDLLESESVEGRQGIHPRALRSNPRRAAPSVSASPNRFAETATLQIKHE
jgi:hypothetical protein